MGDAQNHFTGALRFEQVAEAFAAALGTYPAVRLQWSLLKDTARTRKVRAA